MTSWKGQASRLIAARIFSTIAFQIQAVAVGWQVYQLSRSPLLLGYLGLVQFVPMVLFAIPAGQVADRFSRRLVLGLCLGGAALCSFGLAWHARNPTPALGPIFVFLFLEAVARAFGGSANQSLLPQIVPTEHFPRAVAWSSSGWQASLIIGPAIGGFLYGWTNDPTLVYGAAGALLVLSLGLLGAVGRVESGRERAPLTWESLFAGFTYVGKKRAILGSVSLDLFAVLLGGAVALFPIFAAEVLQAGPWALGWLRSAPGIGAAFTAVWLGVRPIRRSAGRKMFAAVALFGLAMAGFGLSRSFPLSFLFLLVSGAADVVSVVVRQTLVQLETPPEMRGRVSSVNLIFISASNELGEFESGLAAQWLGLVPAVVLGGLGTCLVALVWARLFPELWRLDSLTGRK